VQNINLTPKMNSCCRSFAYSPTQIVLDESNNAARRARANAEAMVKYKQRKMNIEKALFTRLIVDDDDDDNDDRGKSQDGCPEQDDL